MTLKEECVFCDLIRLDDPKLTKESASVYSFEPLNPVTEGHRLFVSDQHFLFPHQYPSMTGLLFHFASKHAGKEKWSYNLIVNAGTPASQTVNHVHVHYVPRRENDGLKLPWTDQEK